MDAGGTLTAGSEAREGIRSGQSQHHAQACGRGHESGDVVGVGHPQQPMSQREIPNSLSQRKLWDSADYPEWPKVADAVIEARFSILAIIRLLFC